MSAKKNVAENHLRQMLKLQMLADLRAWNDRNIDEVAYIFRRATDPKSQPISPQLRATIRGRLEALVAGADGTGNPKVMDALIEVQMQEHRANAAAGAITMAKTGTM